MARKSLDGSTLRHKVSWYAEIVDPTQGYAMQTESPDCRRPVDARAEPGSLGQRQRNCR